jgi:hypothetical protein
MQAGREQSIAHGTLRFYCTAKSTVILVLSKAVNLNEGNQIAWRLEEVDGVGHHQKASSDSW